MSIHFKVLRLIHVLYVAFMTVTAWMQRHERKPPKPLKARRSKIPKHLCLNLVANHDTHAETAFLQILQSVAMWCRILGIETLTVYDRHGILYECFENVHGHVFLVNVATEYSCKPEAKDVPLASSSKLTLRIIFRASGKPTIASASRSLLRSYVSGTLISGDTIPSIYPYNLTVSELGIVLEAGLPSPDLMIIHHIGGTKTPRPPIELHGFPPWQINLTEFYCTLPDDHKLDPHGSETLGISETAFCRALDEYSGAEFRLGR